jgi:hypothetical protein
MGSDSIELRLRSRTDDEAAGPRVVVSDWRPARAAVIICDMWDTVQCVSAARRMAEMAARMHAVVSHLRERGALIINAPADCVDFYRGTPARWRALAAPHADAPVPFRWNPWDGAREAALPPSLYDPGPCSCDSPEPCCEVGTPNPWTRQHPAIGVADEDAVSEDGQEIFNLLAHRRIDDVVVMGVHTNVCVLARWYGIRQWVYVGKRPILCRDLTDSYHRDPRGHGWGNDTMVAHIERYWCPTVTSDQLAGGDVFRFGQGR